MMNQHHPFHMVFPSPWPIMTGFSVLSMLTGSVLWMSTKDNKLMIMGTLTTSLCCSQWWRDISRESSFQGFHSNLVMNGLRWGMILFITSEVLFFFSFFWAFFHSSLAPNLELGMMWPPMGIKAINPFQVPLLNTTVLLASGITVTLAHHALIMKDNTKMKLFMAMTVFLGVYFSMLQGWEYWEASYSMSDSSFGSAFFLATGFHGIHVLIGTIFLFFSLLRHNMNLYSYSHHLGLECGIWYWHFVDVVWLFLYSFLYWWSF